MFRYNYSIPQYKIVLKGQSNYPSFLFTSCKYVPKRKKSTGTYSSSAFLWSECSYWIIGKTLSYLQF